MQATAVATLQKAESRNMVISSDGTGASNGSGNKNEFESLSWRLGAWGDTFGYPRAVSTYKSRVFWGGFPLSPRTLVYTYVDKLRAFSPSSSDGTVTDAHGGLLEFRTDKILWLAEGVTKLIIGASEAVHSLGPSNDEPFGPRNLLRRRETDSGTTQVKPANVANSIVHTTPFGTDVRDLYYDPSARSLTTPPFASMSDHLFEAGVKEFAVQNTPRTVVWMLLYDGTLVSTTLDRYEKVIGFSRHDVSGFVHSMCVVPSPEGYDELTLAVERNGQHVMETLEPQFSARTSKEDAYFVDGGGVYTGAPVTTVTGLTWLNGQEVQILADGHVLAAQTVSAGTITLPFPASKIAFGRKIANHVKTLRAPLQTRDGSPLGRRTRVVQVIFDVYRTLGLKVKVARGHVERLFRIQGDNTLTFAPVPLVTGTDGTPIDGGWDNEGSIEFFVDDPLPATVRALNINIDVEP